MEKQRRYKAEVLENLVSRMADSEAVTRLGSCHQRDISGGIEMAMAAAASVGSRADVKTK
jgi:hypothetical protein